MTRLTPCQADPRDETWHPTTATGIDTARALCGSCWRLDTCRAETLTAEKGLPIRDRHGITAAMTGRERWAAANPDTATPCPECGKPVARPDSTYCSRRCATIAHYRAARKTTEVAA